MSIIVLTHLKVMFLWMIAEIEIKLKQKMPGLQKWKSEAKQKLAEKLLQATACYRIVVNLLKATNSDKLN